ERVMRRGCLWHFMVGLRLDGVHEIRKFDRVLNKKDWHIIPHQIEVAVFGIELHSKTTHVPRKIRGSTRSDDSGKAHEHRGSHRRILKEFGFRQGRLRFVHLKYSMR